jgi:hypothetical protein
MLKFWGRRTSFNVQKVRWPTGNTAKLDVETRLSAGRPGRMIAPKPWHGRLTADEPT